MARFRQLSALDRRLLLALLACALLARLLVPAGWMPVAHDGAIPRLVLCDGATGQAAMAGHHGTPGHHEGPIDHPCAFATTATAMDVPLLAVPPIPGDRAYNAAPVVRIVAVGRGLAAPPPPPTGPPPFA